MEDNGKSEHPSKPELCGDASPFLKVPLPPVIKIQNESSITPVSSGGEEDEDVKSFFEVLEEDGSWQEPAPELVEKIRSLLDMYFSDDNLLKDKFLLKHVKRNRLGYVSVKLLTSFKKLKSLSRSDWKLTAYCISKSDKLQLNKSGTKVRRKDALPDVDLPTTSVKTILYKLGNDTEEVAINQLSDRFQTFGKLTTLRIVQPGKEVPLDLRNHTIKHPELGTNLCVVVEYDSTEDAQNAYKTLSKEARNDNKNETFSLLGSGRNPKKQAAKSLVRHRDGFSCDSADESSCVSSRENSPMMPRRKLMVNGALNRRSSSPLVSPNGSRDVSPERFSEGKRRDSPQMHRKHHNSNHSTPSGSPWFPRKNHVNSSRSGDNNITTPEPSPRSSPLLSRALNKHAKTTSPLANNLKLSPDPGNNVTSVSGRSSPWLERKRQFVASQGNSPASTPGSSPSLGRKYQDGVPIGVTRLPRGPPSNLVKGFESNLRSGMNKMKLKSSPVAAEKPSACGDGSAVVK